ncbi:unnamed protein product [Didymodactylos carnosus]|uniref:Uncharacterized protein n=1 Tax=Didymodactylos carnosus TaxID=1234261 RepID=A0A814B4I7_9BILA|nr:unnamed protein product [Didymodactylos carnosus]CAF1388131.1 unnamed protein product [Didymodactylos carnosus]CAF3702131.1 unnamed protein product [Didymodactylos carnosus]CAF4195956.1 unnamed protein product [Didymodactylos carnosus]
MLALFAIFEHLSNVRRVLNRYNFLYTSSTTTPDEGYELKPIVSGQSVPIDRRKSSIIYRNSLANILPSYQVYEHNILLTPIVHHIIIQLNPDIIPLFDSDFLDDLHEQHELARELDACLLEIKTIEKDLYNVKQRQCDLYESFLEFVDKKDELIQLFVDYYSEYYEDGCHEDEQDEFREQTQKTNKNRKTLRRQSTIYEYTIPVSNRYEMLRRESLLHILAGDLVEEQQ